MFPEVHACTGHIAYLFFFFNNDQFTCKIRELDGIKDKLIVPRKFIHIYFSFI